MQEDSQTKNFHLTNSRLNLANVAIVVILTASVVYERFSIYYALGSSLIIWIIFGGHFAEIKENWQERRNLVDQGIPLYQFCNDCGLRFSVMKNQCPRCELIVSDNLRA